MSSPATQLTQTPTGEPTVEVAATAPLEHQEIERLAYSCWEARAYPHGSPEEDWFRAEEELHRKQSAHLIASALGLPH